MRSLVLTSIGAAVGVLAATANAAPLRPVAWEATHYSEDDLPDYAFDRREDYDFLGADQVDVFSDWVSNNEGTSAKLRMDFGSVFTFGGAVVTDRVTSGSYNWQFVGGLYDFTSKFSIQGFLDAEFTQAVGSALVFNRTEPTNPTQSSDFALNADLMGLTARYVEYRVLETNGINPGLADISFFAPDDLPADFATAVPEPSTLTIFLAGIGFAGTALRRRRSLIQALPSG